MKKSKIHCISAFVSIKGDLVGNNTDTGKSSITLHCFSYMYMYFLFVFNRLLKLSGIYYFRTGKNIPSNVEVCVQYVNMIDNLCLS